MYQACSILFQEISEYAASEEGFSKFLAAQGDEANWTMVKRHEVARERQRQFINDTDIVLKRMERQHPAKRYAAEQSERTGIIKEGREKFEKSSLHDPKLMIPLYLESNYVKQLEDELIKTATEDEKVVPIWSKVQEQQNIIMNKISFKAGNRNDALANCTIEDFLTALENGYCAYPHKPLHHIKDVPESCIDDRGEEGVYYRNPNPWVEDENDPNKDQCSSDWEKLRGYCMICKFQKTSKGQPVFIWLTQPDMYFLQLYVAYAERYLRSIGQKMSISTPLFMNSSGNLHSSRNQYTKFLEITQMPRMTGYMNRRWFLEFTWDQGSETLRQWSTYACANSIQVQAKHYVPDRTKQKFAALANAEFRKSLNLAEDSIAFGNKEVRMEINKTVTDKMESLAKDVNEVNMEKFLRIQSQSNTAPRLNRVVTEKEKVALIQMVWLASKQKCLITKHGDVAQIFLVGRGKSNVRNQVLIMRLIDMLPNWQCVSVLKENLYAYCRLLNDGSVKNITDMRPIERDWSFKLCAALESLGRNTTTGSSMIVKLLNDIYIQTGSDQYTLGSPILRNQVLKWKTHETKKQENKMSVPEFHQKLRDNCVYPKQVEMPEGTSTNQDEEGVFNERRELEVENVVFSLPPSPLKTRIQVGNQVIESIDSVQISTVKNVVKNVTTDKKGRTLFNNSMKRSLLELYIKLAANPLATGKAAMSRECINIWENESIDMGGDQIKLKHLAFSYGTLGDILYRRGKGGHTAGLSYPIFKV